MDGVRVFTENGSLRTPRKLEVRFHLPTSDRRAPGQEILDRVPTPEIVPEQFDRYAGTAKAEHTVHQPWIGGDEIVQPDAVPLAHLPSSLLPALSDTLLRIHAFREFARSFQPHRRLSAPSRRVAQGD